MLSSTQIAFHLCWGKHWRNCIAIPTFVKYEIDIEEDENGAACLQIAIDAAEVLENNHYLECSGWSCEDWLEKPKNGKIAYMVGH
jgi:hypothetical protein